VNRHRPRARAASLRRAASQLIFAWGSVLSAAWYALLTLLGRPPVLDDHLTVTAITMLCAYLSFRFGLDLWLNRTDLRRRGDQR
jgi:hypothetical protein